MHEKLDSHGNALRAMLFGATAQGWAAGLVARIDISSQTMTVAKHGRVIHKWRVSTARRGYVTPRGTYRPTPDAQNVALAQIRHGRRCPTRSSSAAAMPSTEPDM